jgi:hypothetical protein
MNEAELSGAAARGKMLPGVAGICLFLFVLTSINVFGAVQGAFGGGAAKYGILTLCTMLVAGLAGLVRMRRWGWSIVLAGCLLLAAADTYFYTRVNVGFFLVRAFFMLVFFFYLVRPEVRDRMV